MLIIIFLTNSQKRITLFLFRLRIEFEFERQMSMRSSGGDCITYSISTSSTQNPVTLWAGRNGERACTRHALWRTETVPNFILFLLDDVVVLLACSSISLCLARSRKTNSIFLFLTEIERFVHIFVSVKP